MSDADITTNLQYWDALKHPPATALKTIKGGRLSGMTDIKPQWRYEAMTATFGPCGEGWKYTIDKLWAEKGSADQIMAFAQVSVYYRTESGTWSDPLPGVGGSMLVTKELSGLHTSDEGYKMAITDALSVAMKCLGVGADIYNGYWDGSKYKDSPTEATAPATPPPPAKTGPPAAPAKPSAPGTISEPQAKRLFAIAKGAGWADDDIKLCVKSYGYDHTRDILKADYEAICAVLEKGPRIDGPHEEEVPF